MEFTELLDEIQIVGAGQGDVVFIEVADTMSFGNFVQFGDALRAYATGIRADGFFPHCVILPPGTRAVVAHHQPKDEHVSGSDVPQADLTAAPDDGFPHG